METILTQISVILAPALLAVTLHEVAHGYVADKLGDPTARLLGRLTLNPLRHLDPIGTLAVLIFAFGWARPMPINASNLGHPRRDMAWVALAGPLTSLMLAALSAAILNGLVLLDSLLAAEMAHVSMVIVPLKLMAAFSLYVNVILGAFNLLPIPPLDGGRALSSLLPERHAGLLARFEPFGLILLIFLIFFTDLWRVVLEPAILFLVSVLAGANMPLVHQVIPFLLGR